MKFAPVPLDGAYLVRPEAHEDERGSFARVWCAEEFEAHGLNPALSQCSISRSTRAGTLRGLHFQRPPHEEAKLVRCLRGRIFDVVVDIRADSPTYMQWFGIELDAAEGAALYVPEGLAHGFQTLTSGAEVIYFISRAYNSASSSGVRWDDPAFGIDWPSAARRTISERDLGWPDFKRKTR